MNQLPFNPLSPEAQQKLMEQMYLLMGQQVQSYYKHRHMGNNSSVPVELAQELMASVEYTVNSVGGVYAHRNVAEALHLGQEILEEKCSKAKSILELVKATAPRWQTQCRWDALGYLRHYLDSYDPLHLAHKGPEDLFYPILTSPPEGIQGIDSCLFYLNILWIENQIMAGIPEDVLEPFWNRLPDAALNQCEYLLINGIGKALFDDGMGSLVFEPEEYLQLLTALVSATEESIQAAAKRLCRWLALKDENAAMYVETVVPQLCMWIGDNARNGNLENLFV